MLPPRKNIGMNSVSWFVLFRAQLWKKHRCQEIELELVFKCFLIYVYTLCDGKSKENHSTQSSSASCWAKQLFIIHGRCSRINGMSIFIQQ